MQLCTGLKKKKRKRLGRIVAAPHLTCAVRKRLGDDLAFRLRSSDHFLGTKVRIKDLVIELIKKKVGNRGILHSYIPEIFLSILLVGTIAYFPFFFPTILFNWCMHYIISLLK